MGKYEEYVSKFLEDYEQPVADEYIVGFSGLDPDRKIKPEEIDHEKLDGLLGGDFAGRYHVTNDELRKFIGYEGQIDELSRQTTAEFVKVRKEVSDGLNEVEDTAHKELEGLRESAYGELARVERETSAELSRIDFQTVEAISTHKRDTQTALSEIRGEVNTFTSQAGNRLSVVEERNAEISSEQGLMKARYESAMSNLTSDSEVKDARVSRDGSQYATLGSRLLALENASGETKIRLHESDAGLWDAIQEVSTETGSTLLFVMDMQSEESSKRESEDAEIRRQADLTRKEDRENAARIYEQLREELSATRQETTEHGEHLQEQADELSGEILRLTYERESDVKDTAEKLSQVYRDISASREQTVNVKEHMQVQADETASIGLQTAIGLKAESDTRKTETQKLREDISQESRERETADEELREQILRETDSRESSDNELRASISASRETTQRLYEQLRDESDELSGEILRQTYERESDQAQTAQVLQRESNQRTQQSTFQQEQINEVSSGVMMNAVTQARESEKLREVSTGLKEQIRLWEEWSIEFERRVREGLVEARQQLEEISSENAVGILGILLEVVSIREKHRELHTAMNDGMRQTLSEIARKNTAMYENIQGLQEQINDLAYTELTKLKTDYETANRMAVIEGEYDAILSEIDPEYEPAEDAEIDDMIDKVLAGEEVTGDGEYSDPEFDAMIDEILGT